MGGKTIGPGKYEKLTNDPVDVRPRWNKTTSERTNETKGEFSLACSLAHRALAFIFHISHTPLFSLCFQYSVCFSYVPPSFLLLQPTFSHSFPCLSVTEALQSSIFSYFFISPFIFFPTPTRERQNEINFQRTSKEHRKKFQVKIIKILPPLHSHLLPKCWKKKIKNTIPTFPRCELNFDVKKTLSRSPPKQRRI